MTFRTFATITISLATVLFAQTETTQFVPFKDFLASTKAPNAHLMTRANSRVRDSKHFEEMRKHVTSMYDGARVSHSFVRHSSTFDCMPIEDQPSVRLLKLKALADAPPMSMLEGHAVDGEDSGQFASRPGSQDPENATDDFGNATTCEDKTFPMRRITLEEMTQFPTLQDFFAKKPEGASSSRGPVDEVAPATGAPHKYAHMWQFVNNLGGNSSINLQRPYVNTYLGQIFSLNQQWYVGGSGASTQTAEVGIQNYPGKYGNQNSRLFIYYTADNYTHTGCYNHDCAAFVQTNNTYTMGGGFATYSTAGGTQYDYAFQFRLYNGNWWLAVQGNWVGYYPGSLYNGGQLTRFAQRIDYGVETVGTTNWPGAGSGYWGTAGWDYAAYQRNIYYFNLSSTTVWASLTPVQPSPACYNMAGPYYSSTAGWGVYFYAGGPGGANCQ